MQKISIFGEKWPKNGQFQLLLKLQNTGISSALELTLIPNFKKIHVATSKEICKIPKKYEKNIPQRAIFTFLSKVLKPGISSALEFTGIFKPDQIGILCVQKSFSLDDIDMHCLIN